jgi:hypothetical protein
MRPSAEFLGVCERGVVVGGFGLELLDVLHLLVVVVLEVFDRFGDAVRMAAQDGHMPKAVALLPLEQHGARVVNGAGKVLKTAASLRLMCDPRDLDMCIGSVDEDRWLSEGFEGLG